MARIGKYFLLFLILLGACFCSVKADEVSDSALTTPQYVGFERCVRVYPLNAEKLYYMSIASINANRFQTLELQSKMGYILFKAVNKEFLISIIKIDDTKSMIKITPANNNYFFAPGIVSNIYKYIDMYGATPVTTIKKAS